jgi:hypothetical protein
VAKQPTSRNASVHRSLDMLFREDVDTPFQEGETSVTPLHHLADLADPFEYSTHVNQLILAKQLIERGANVNAASSVNTTPLHAACFAGNVTNLDFVEYLLEVGANPNAQDHMGMTPVMYGTPHAPGAAKFLLNWPTTDTNITTRSGASFQQVGIRDTIKLFSDEVARPNSPNRGAESVRDRTVA